MELGGHFLCSGGAASQMHANPQPLASAFLLLRVYGWYGHGLPTQSPGDPFSLEP